MNKKNEQTDEILRVFRVLRLDTEEKRANFRKIGQIQLPAVQEDKRRESATTSDNTTRENENA